MASVAAPFTTTQLQLHTPAQAARNLLLVVDALTAGANGGFFDWRGDTVPW